MRVQRFIAAMAVVLATAALSGVALGAEPAIDISYIRPDHFVAVVLHPKRIAALPQVAPQFNDPQVADAIKQLGIDPREIEQLTIFWSMNKVELGGRVRLGEPTPIVVAQFTRAVSARDILVKLEHAAQPNTVRAIVELPIGDKTCYQVKDSDQYIYQPASTTVVAAFNRYDIEKVVAGGGPSGPLLERIETAQADSDVLLVFTTDARGGLKELLDAASAGAPEIVRNYLSAAKTLHGGTLAVSLSGQALLRLRLDAKNAEAADNAEDLLRQLLRMAAGGVAMARQSLPPEARGKLAPLLKLADQCLDGAKISRAGTQVALDVQRPEILGTDGAAIMDSFKQSVIEARAAARRTMQMNNLKQIALAMIDHEIRYEAFPPAVIEKDGKPLLSWRVAILPGIDEEALYKEFHLDEPWDSPHNLEVAKKMPSIYQSPDSPAEGKTRVMLFTGKGAAFDGGKKIRLDDIHDGTSVTILCVEAGPDKAVPWTKPEDLLFDPEKPLAALGKIPAKGFLAVFFDGHVEALTVDNATLKALITPAGGEVIDMSKERSQ